MDITSREERLKACTCPREAFGYNCLATLLQFFAELLLIILAIRGYRGGLVAEICRLEVHERYRRDC